MWFLAKTCDERVILYHIQLFYVTRGNVENAVYATWKVLEEARLAKKNFSRRFPFISWKVNSLLGFRSRMNSIFT